jgi:hypothetical protein
MTHPDFRIRYKIQECEACHRDLSGHQPEGIQEKQVFDWPPFQLSCTSFKAEMKIGPDCGKKNEE